MHVRDDVMYPFEATTQSRRINCRRFVRGVQPIVCDEGGEQGHRPWSAAPWPACLPRCRFSRDAREVSLSLATVLRQRGKARGRECETHHTRIAEPALMLGTAGGGLSRICDNDDAANDHLVVQSGDVRAISRSLPVPAARALKVRWARRAVSALPDQFAKRSGAVLHRIASLPGQVSQLAADRVVAAQPARPENMADIGREAADLG